MPRMLENHKIKGTFLNENTRESSFIKKLRSIAIQELKLMYRPDERLFVHHLRRTNSGVISEGLSHRYTAIVLIGLAEEKEDVINDVLGNHSLRMVCDRLEKDIHLINDLGDVSLILWAASVCGYSSRREILNKLIGIEPEKKPFPVVELSWALTALCHSQDITNENLRNGLAHRLMSAFNETTNMFPHVLGNGNGGSRSHISCFADMIYPIQALSFYSKQSSDNKALDIASRCAEKISGLQGSMGQWWWHYDFRTGNIVEPYPVYSVHQDAMAPMGLFTLSDSGGPLLSNAIKVGLEWLAHSPELNDSLVDENSSIIWRKVARNEPGKFSRFSQAIASRLHPNLRVPWLNKIFYPDAIDYESRPYHLGWLLHAWPENRLTKWEKGELSL